MDPLTMALVGLDLGGNFMNSWADSAANEDQQKFAERMFDVSKINADRYLDFAKSSRTDALGNTVRWDPYKGWVTDLTDSSRSLLEATLRENLLRTTVDQAKAREARGKEYERADQYGYQSDRDFTEYAFGPRQTLGEMESLFAALAAREREKGLTDVTNAYGRQAIRAKDTTSLERVVRQAIQQRSGNLKDAALEGKLKALQAYGGQENIRGGLLQRAIAGSNRARGITSTPMGDTMGIQGATANAQGNQVAQSLNAMGTGNTQMLNTMGKQLPLVGGGQRAMGDFYGDIGETLNPLMPNQEGGSDFGQQQANDLSTGFIPQDWQYPMMFQPYEYEAPMPARKLSNVGQF